LNIADQLIAQPEGIVPIESPDRELFSLLSDFYLNPQEAAADDSDLDSDDLMNNLLDHEELMV
jgi:light-independent protochlorophyllide reductase subunit L